MNQDLWGGWDSADGMFDFLIDFFYRLILSFLFLFFPFRFICSSEEQEGKNFFADSVSYFDP